MPTDVIQKTPEELQAELISIFETMITTLTLFQYSCGTKVSGQVDEVGRQKIAHLSQKRDDVYMALLATINSLDPFPVTLDSLEKEFNSLVVDFSANTVLLAVKARRIAKTSNEESVGLLTLAQKILEVSSFTTSITEKLGETKPREHSRPLLEH